MQSERVTVQHTAAGLRRRDESESPEEIVARALLILEEESRSWMASMRNGAAPVATAERRSGNSS